MIIIDREVFTHDVIIRLSGQVKKRNKKLSTSVSIVYGASHVMALAEAKHVYEPGTDQFIVDTGRQGNVTLSAETADYCKRKQCHVALLATLDAMRVWNEIEDAVISLFHITV